MLADFKAHLEDLLLETHSRVRTDAVAAMIGGDADRFEAAWEIFCNGEPPLPQRMAWVLDVVTEAHPSHAARYGGTIAARLPYLLHPAERRAATKILCRTTLPAEAIGDLANICFEWLENPQEPAAIRCNAMQILYKISNLEPDLKRELAMIIDALMVEGGPAIRSRGRKILARLIPELREAT
jgi:hypothetical protein